MNCCTSDSKQRQKKVNIYFEDVYRSSLKVNVSENLYHQVANFFKEEILIISNNKQFEKNSNYTLESLYEQQKIKKKIDLKVYDLKSYESKTTITDLQKCDTPTTTTDQKSSIKSTQFSQTCFQQDQIQVSEFNRTQSQTNITQNQSKKDHYQKQNIITNKLQQENIYPNQIQHKSKSDVKNLKSSTTCSISRSFTFTSKYLCSKCVLSINSDIIQLSCQHVYHDCCFNEQLQIQIIKNMQCKLYCMCKQQIKIRTLQLLSIHQFYISTLLENQLKFIKMQLENKKMILKCSQSNCSFFFIYDNSKIFLQTLEISQNVDLTKFSNKESFYCPQCLQ